MRIHITSKFDTAVEQYSQNSQRESSMESTKLTSFENSLLDTGHKDTPIHRLMLLLAVRKSFPLLPSAFFLPLFPAVDPSIIKPTQCFIGLIARCILKSPERRLKLKEIYQSLWDEHPYFRKRKNWQLSVRRNLTRHDCFVKTDWMKNMFGDFQPQGKDIRWSVHPACIKDFERGEFDKTRIRLRIETPHQNED